MTPPAFRHDEIETTKNPRTWRGFVVSKFDERSAFNHPRRTNCKRMNYGDQLARRLGTRQVKDAPASPPAPDLLQPHSPAARRGSVPPAIPLNLRQATRHDGQTLRPATMSQRIKPRTWQTVHPISHDTPTGAQPSTQPTTATRSQRHRRISTRANRHSSTEPPRSHARILPAVKKKGNTAQTVAR